MSVILLTYTMYIATLLTCCLHWQPCCGCPLQSSSRLHPKLGFQIQEQCCTSAFCIILSNQTQYISATLPQIGHKASTNSFPSGNSKSAASCWSGALSLGMSSGLAGACEGCAPQKPEKKHHFLRQQYLIHECIMICISYAPRGREVKAGIPRSSGVGRRGFDPRQLRRTKRAFFQPLAI